MVLTNLPFNLKGHPHFLFRWSCALSCLCFVCTYFLYFRNHYNICSFYLFLTFESQPQTHAPFPHVESNLTNHCALKKPKRIKKKLFSNKIQGFTKHKHIKVNKYTLSIMK